MGLISFSGRAQSGKDTSGSIAQILLNSPQLNNEGVKDFLKKNVSATESPYYNKWVIKKFADKLKDIVCLLLGCTREQLEDERYKNSTLPEVWWYYNLGGLPNKIVPRGYFPNAGDNEMCEKRYLVRPTPRLFLQLIGTEGGRNLIHPNVWVNSTFADYTELVGYAPGNYWSKCGNCGEQFSGDKRAVRCKKCSVYEKDWILTDMRFPNEAQAIKERGGLLIRIERPWFYTLLEDGRHKFSDKEDESGHVYLMAAKYTKEEAEVLYQNDYSSKVHESETALDNYQDWSYVIVNDGTLDDLIDKIREILIKEELLTKN